VTQDYFSILHDLSVNIEPVSSNQLPASLDALNTEMPIPFKMANEVANIDASALRSIRNLGDQADSLADFLQMQNEKINLIMGYVLMQQDDIAYRFHTETFSAGGMSVISDRIFKLDQPVRIKLFLPSESSAIYCYGIVSACMDTNQDQQFSYTFSFSHIREIDREILIRSTLHIQQQQLKLRAEQRQQNPS